MDDCRSVVNITELAQLHYAPVYRYAYRVCGSAELAEDLTQQAFLTALRRLDQLREPKAARSWLYAITRNAFLTQVGSHRSPRTFPLGRFAEPVEELPHETIIDPDELQKALMELPEEFRTPLILFYFEEFSYREIAEQMEVPVGTVMSRLARAKSHLRRRLAPLQTMLAPSGEEPDSVF